MLENGGWGGADFMVFPNVRICLAPCGNGYHRFGVVDSLESHHYFRRDARPCVSTITRVYGFVVRPCNCRPCASKTIIAVHVSTIIPVRLYNSSGAPFNRLISLSKSEMMGCVLLTCRRHAIAHGNDGIERVECCKIVLSVGGSCRDFLGN